jgi:hypothetical protein
MKIFDVRNDRGMHGDPILAESLEAAEAHCAEKYKKGTFKVVGELAAISLPTLATIIGALIPREKEVTRDVISHLRRAMRHIRV